MKKLLIAMLAVASFAAVAHADDSYVAGGFEASGHVNTGVGYQRTKSTGPAGAYGVPADINNTGPGSLGAYIPAARNTNKSDNFRFFVDEVELDIAKNFGENIRARVDLDFGSASLHSRTGPVEGTGGNLAGVEVEQAYATTNIAVGNGLEMLWGRFNAPIGFEKVDVNDNDTISRSAIFRALRFNTLTGAKFHYAFTDSVDWVGYVANNNFTSENQSNGTVTNVPLVGTRVGFNWGDEGKKSTIGVSGAVGQDHGNVEKHMSFLGDVDWLWHATDSLAVGGEGLYRQIDTTTVGGKNGKYFAGLVNLKYNFSDVWDGTLKYAFSDDNNGLANAGVAPVGAANGGQSLLGDVAGAKIIMHELTAAGNYAISDGAKLKLEGNYTFVDRHGGLPNQQVFGGAAMFAYEF